MWAKKFYEKLAKIISVSAEITESNLDECISIFINCFRDCSEYSLVSK